VRLSVRFFSSSGVQALMLAVEPFCFCEYFRQSRNIRAELQKNSLTWPNVSPQLWIKGELVGGCDINCLKWQVTGIANLINAAVGNN